MELTVQMGTRAGNEYRWKRHDSLTVRGNKWYRHSQSKGGVPITKISIGHMQAGEGKRSVTPTVAVDNTDIAAFKELQALGIELEIRYLPSSAPDPIGNLFN